MVFGGIGNDILCIIVIFTCGKFALIIFKS